MTYTLVAFPRAAGNQQHEFKPTPQTSISGSVSWHVTSEPIWVRSTVTREDALRRIATGIADRHAGTFKRLAKE